MYEIDDFFARHIENNLYPAIECTMTKNTLYACAMLLHSYTEIMGGYMTGNLMKEKHGRKNYDAFLRFMGEPYCKLLDQNPDVNFYRRVRSGLIHEGELKGQYGIWITEKPQKDRIGIEYYSRGDHVNVNVQEYFRDFKQGIDRLHKQLNDYLNNTELYVNFVSCRRKRYDGLATTEK